MRQFFNMDGPVFTFLSKMADLLILNLLFIVCSIPVITIGASLTAMSCVSIKMKDGLEGYVWKTFLKSFRDNFRQATIIWVFMALAAIILAVDILLVRSSAGTLQHVVQISVYVGILLWIMFLSVVFPLLSRFDNSIPNTMRNAVLLAIGNAPRTLLMSAIIFGSVIATLWNAMTLSYGLLIWLLFGFAILSWIDATLLYPVFKKLMPPEEETGDEGTDSNCTFFRDDPAPEDPQPTTTAPEENK